MIIYPAIDLKQGKCVRLLQGDMDKTTVYSENPVEVAQRWEALGAKFLHLVDLDGAFSGDNPNLDIIKDIVQSVDIPVQVGGGIRDLDRIKLMLEDIGVARVIVGTAAVEVPGMVKAAVDTYRSRIAVGLDAKDGKVATRGWVKNSRLDVLALARDMEDMGVSTVIYTDIAKDGMLTGPNLETTKALVENTGMDIIASGGVSRLEDISRLKAIGVSGVIVGKALYTGKIDLREALRIQEG
ncbi:MAG TPA: 1-(5-phosphoribosyl)-5-[(5-phosphoribosylamino)methylideneamino]imidazole-4-carboxamide isomerase [Clostridiales bacterium]|nr:1-(5-phosphoribosyl)-5-[(5-phosphoribosylamino)methylideneamino]imidazole-4-carboxamide isomerase [Clostridiales bacterium]